MSSRLNFIRDVAGNNTFGLHFADVKYNVILILDLEQSMAVPETSKNWLVIFSYEPGSTVWVAKNATAAHPVGPIGTTDSELNPTARFVKGGDAIHLITQNADAKVGLTFYSLDGPTYAV